MTNQLEKIEGAARALAEAETLDEIKYVRDIASAAAEYARAAKLGLEAQNSAATIKLRAERKAGELLAGLERGQGSRTDLTLSNNGQSSPYAATLADTDTTRQQANRWQTVARLPEEKFEAYIEETIEAGNEVTTAGALRIAQNVHVANNSGNNEWYTPPEYIEAARAVMGGIDTDPASSAVANQTVKAGVYFDREYDGLRREWHGRLWLNPPYSQPEIGDFCAKLVAEIDGGRVRQAITLTNNATETGWFRVLAERCTAVCFPASRIRFLDAQGNANGAPLQGQAVMYFGNRTDMFAREFARFGLVFYAR